MFKKCHSGIWKKYLFLTQKGWRWWGDWPSVIPCFVRHYLLGAAKLLKQKIKNSYRSWFLQWLFLHKWSSWGLSKKKHTHTFERVLKGVPIPFPSPIFLKVSLCSAQFPFPFLIFDSFSHSQWPNPIPSGLNPIFLVQNLTNPNFHFTPSGPSPDKVLICSSHLSD